MCAVPEASLGCYNTHGLEVEEAILATEASLKHKADATATTQTAMQAGFMGCEKNTSDMRSAVAALHGAIEHLKSKRPATLFCCVPMEKCARHFLMHWVFLASQPVEFLDSCRRVVSARESVHVSLRGHHRNFATLGPIHGTDQRTKHGMPHWRQLQPVMRHPYLLRSTNTCQ